MELELQPEEKDSEISSDLFEHKHEDLNSLARKIDLVEGMVEDRLKTNEGNFNGSNVVIK